MLTPEAALAVLEQEAAAFATLLDDADLQAPVHGCPGWSTADLTRHLGGIHRWAREAVLRGPSDEEAGPDDPAALAPWFREGAALLLETLRAEDPDRPCWGFGPQPRTVAFWLRRQAHETALHRWDAEQALGGSPRLDEDLARDGLDEVATVFLPRQLRLGRLQPAGALLALQPRQGEPVLLDVGAAPGARASATVSGPAEALLLLVWGRLPLDDARLALSGDGVLARELLALPLVP
ncbi:MAG: maleylpyruvate isomerase family mycothiol-dependent enzyme [Frankiales bacterium]|nr:maleylpyruvate isomerase family mycothiol-dependent enzyme [Frankiales bacterium]